MKESGCIAKLVEDYTTFMEADSNIWADIFKMPFNITREHKL